MKVLLRIKKAPRYYILKSQMSLFGGNTHPEKVTVRGKHKTYIATRHKKNAESPKVDAKSKTHYNISMVKKPLANKDDFLAAEERLRNSNIIGKLVPADNGVHGTRIAKLDNGKRAILKVNDWSENDVDNELASYIVSRESGLDVVPPTVKVNLGERFDYEDAMLQDFIPNAKTANHIGRLNSDKYTTPEIEVFYYLVSHGDRNGGNRIKDGSGRWWAIDNATALDEPAKKGSTVEDAERVGSDMRDIVTLHIFNGLANMERNREAVDKTLEPLISPRRRMLMWQGVRSIVHGLRDRFPSDLERRSGSSSVEL